MPYCTASDVQVYLTNITLSTITKPTLAEVTQMCTDVSDNVIDPVIRKYLTLPITDSVGLNYLKQGAIYSVMASVNRGFFGATEDVINLEAKFDDFLLKLKNNNTLLVLQNEEYPVTTHSVARTPKYNLDQDEDLW